jgi:hypothetical protein
LCKSLRCSYPTLLLKRTIYRDFGVEEICLFFHEEKGVFLQWLSSTRGTHGSIIRLEVQGFPHSYCEGLRWCVTAEVRSAPLFRKTRGDFSSNCLVGELDLNIQSYAATSYTKRVLQSTIARACLTAQTYTFVDSSRRFRVT